MTQPDDQLQRQYADARNLHARMGLHQRFSTNPYGWVRWVFDQLDLPANAAVLELGCGDGTLWATNRARIDPTWRITLSDSSPGMIEQARRNLAGITNVSFQVANAESIPFGDATFDAVIANHMLYHVGNLDGALCEIRRVLKPDGRLYATTVGNEHLRELRELVRPLAPDIRFVRNDTARSFGLQNGAGALSRHFASVHRHMYEDSLAVTDSQPLIDWVLSAMGAPEALAGEKTEQLRRQVDERIRAGGGTMHVTKSSGLFVAAWPWVDRAADPTAAGDRLELIQFHQYLFDAFVDYARDFTDSGDNYRREDMRQAIEDWPAFVRQRQSLTLGEGLPPGGVPLIDYCLMRGERIIGFCRFYPVLNEFTSIIGGHIGYEVRPSERGKGYATLMTRLLLDKARRRGIVRVLMTCDKANTASACVIAKCGGVLENEVVSPRDGRPQQRYWIEV